MNAISLPGEQAVTAALFGEVEKRVIYEMVRDLGRVELDISVVASRIAKMFKKHAGKTDSSLMAQAIEWLSICEPLPRPFSSSIPSAYCVFREKRDRESLGVIVYECGYEISKTVHDIWRNVQILQALLNASWVALGNDSVGDDYVREGGEWAPTPETQRDAIRGVGRQSGLASDAVSMKNATQMNLKAF